MRTTLDIEKPVLEDLKKLQRREKKPLGKVVSVLLAQALKDYDRANGHAAGTELEWTTAKMGARVDISDKDALYRVLDQV